MAEEPVACLLVQPGEDPVRRQTARVSRFHGGLRSRRQLPLRDVVGRVWRQGHDNCHPGMLDMESYPIDADAEQVVRWLMAEQAAGSLPLRLSARRLAEVQQIPLRRELHLGDEEREDLSEVAMIGMLEIAPLHASDGWRLTVVVEDESGPRAVDASSSGEQSIDLNTFYREFLRPGRGTASLTAEVDGPEGQAHLARLLNAIETNSHPNGHRVRKH